MKTKKTFKTEKKCSRCGEIKRITYYHKNKNYKDGHFSWCKECVLENKKQRKEPKFRSKLEEKFWAELQKLKTPQELITYESEKIPYTLSKNYNPDFVYKFTNGYKIFIEIKGYNRAEDRQKMLQVIKDNPDKDIRMVFANDAPIYKGSKTRNSDWAKKNNIPYSIGSIPKHWIEEKRELCIKCKKNKRVSSKRQWCKECSSDYHKNYSKDNRDHLKKLSKINKLKRHYNLSIEEFNKMKEKQKNCCAICETSFDNTKVHVDHCHDSGKVRGLLCNMCNTGIGFLKDSYEIVRSAAKYLENAK